MSSWRGNGWLFTPKGKGDNIVAAKDKELIADWLKAHEPTQVPRGVAQNPHGTGIFKGDSSISIRGFRK